jgi:hypothetical protein
MSYPVQRPDETEERGSEAHDTKHCEEVSHWPIVVARLSTRCERGHPPCQQFVNDRVVRGVPMAPARPPCLR